MSLSQYVRNFVHERANQCCEYCRLAKSSMIAPFHIDHIIPIKHDGSDNIDNLCLACIDCNTHKSHDLAGIDPATGKITPLYHPREHQWAEHFDIQANMQITGLTPEGRTTIRVLQINATHRVEYRQTLAQIGEYPCVG